jgi:hypothetical protein
MRHLNRTISTEKQRMNNWSIENCNNKHQKVNCNNKHLSNMIGLISDINTNDKFVYRRCECIPRWSSSTRRVKTSTRSTFSSISTEQRKGFFNCQMNFYNILFQKVLIENLWGQKHQYPHKLTSVPRGKEK